MDRGELVTGVPVQRFSPTKYFDGLPDSFLKHVVFSRKDQGGGDIQGSCSVLITIVTIINYILRSEPNVACFRLRDSGEKSFSKKKCEKRAGAGERREPGTG